jgi:integrase/recombinase XerD
MVPVAAESGIKAARRADAHPTHEPGQETAPGAPTRAEVRDLIAAASNRSTSGVRMRALIAVMVGAGLRLAESFDLEPRDVDTANGTIRVREGKGRKSATVGIDPWTAGHLDRRGTAGPRSA